MKRKLTGEELKWAERALNGQGDVVAAVMSELAPLCTKDEILSKVNARQYAWEPHHVTAAIKNLKDRELVIQKGSARFGLKARQSA